MKHRIWYYFFFRSGIIPLKKTVIEGEGWDGYIDLTHHIYLKQIVYLHMHKLPASFSRSLYLSFL